MLHFTLYHKFTTASGSIILIDSSCNLKTAEERARRQDVTAKYIGIEIKC